VVFCVFWYQAEFYPKEKVAEILVAEGFNGFTMAQLPTDKVFYNKAGQGNGYMLYNSGVGAVTGGSDGLGFGLPDNSGLLISNGVSPWGGGI